MEGRKFKYQDTGHVQGMYVQNRSQFALSCIFPAHVLDRLNCALGQIELCMFHRGRGSNFTLRRQTPNATFLNM